MVSDSTNSRPGGLRFIDSARPALPPGFIAETLREVWGIDGRLVTLGGDRDQNLAIAGHEHNRYLVKISQPAESPGVIDLQIAALRHVAHQDPGLPVPGVVPTANGAYTHAVPAEEHGAHLFRVFEYLPGRPLVDGPREPTLLRQAGARIARLDRALRGFFHPAAGHDLLWDLRQAPALRHRADAITDTGWRDHVLRLLDDFIDGTLPRLAGLRAQVIHGDLTGENVLAGGEPPRITGLIDFGDVVHAPLAQEAAVAMADIPWRLEQPWAAACEVAAGFDAVTPFEDQELALLWHLARARLALTSVVLAARESQRKEGTGSMAGMADTCRRQVLALESIGADRALQQLRRTLRAPSGIAAGAAPDGLGERRGRTLPTLELFYPQRPLHLVRGRGMWLFDAAGTRYLDCYNNVPHVGHAHPHVVNAVARQTAILNTNTRYLYESILEYSERLAALLPGDLGVFLFVNSGSEANDLAWRIARAATGHSGALVTAHAYHGGTEAIHGLSPCGGGSSPGHVRTVLAPDDYRGLAGRGGSDPDYSGDIDRAGSELAAAGHGLAAFMVDTTFASDGILEAPEGYLAQAFEKVRAAGGLCIADEVQAGFGRTGNWWGFEAHGVVPDIVTLGKPMANGYPAGAVVTTPSIMAAFAGEADYFSTFGGNPVACMAGLAVLDVIEREDLLARAREVGQYLRERLEELAARHASIGDVRGRGLFQGMELVRDRTSREPAAAETTAAALDLRDRGVLVGTEGPHGNILKIRPPMVCKKRHVDILADTLDQVLGGRLV